MRLVDLDPFFLKYVGDDSFLMQDVPLSEAQGLWLDCPVCANGHGIMVSFRDRGVQDHQGSHDKDGKPSRWGVGGTGMADLTLDPSIDCTHNNPGCWHGHIRNGEIV